MKKLLFCVKSGFIALFAIAHFGIYAQSPTAPALGFNIFTEGDLNPKTNESEGPVAAGGDLYVDGNYGVSIHSAGSFLVGGIPVGLVVNGRVKYISGNSLKVLSNGYVKIGDPTGSNVWYFDQNNAASPIRITPNSNYNATPRIELNANSNQLNVGVNNNPVFQGNLIDFAAAFSTMRATSTSLSQCEHNLIIKNPNGQVIPNTNLPNQIKIELQDGINVWNVSGSDLANLQVITFENQPNASRYLIVNVNASGNFSWNVPNQTGVAFPQCPFILYNFYNTTALTINGATLEGTVFAPFADVNKPGQSNIEGQMIAKSFVQHGGEMHYAVFSPNVTGCSAAQPVTPTAGFTIEPSTQCLNGNLFQFQNTSTMLACPELTHQTYNSATEVENDFNALYFSAEGRGGNNALNGTFELDIHNVSPYSILSSEQFIWPNNENVPFTIEYNPNAIGNEKFVYKVGQPGVGAGQKTLMLDPEAAGYPTDINAFWFYSRTAANTTLMVSDLTINGAPINMNLGHENPLQTAFTNVAFSGTTLENGFQITGNVRFSWTGTIPQNSQLNFNFKIGNKDCVSEQINQPGLMTYHWNFGDGTTSTQMNPTKNYAFAGTYDVTLTATNSEGSDTYTTQVSVVNPTMPNVSNTIMDSGNGSVTRQFTLNNAAAFSSYSWSGQGSSGLFPNEPVVTFTFNSPGLYAVQLSAIDTNGCGASMALTFSVTSNQVNSGNDGGIESESLGDALTKVYVQRKRNDTPTTFELTEDKLFSQPMSVRTGNQNLIDLFPTSLSNGATPYLSSPTDILDFTIAQEVLSIDFSLQGKTKAVVLGIKTIDRVYNHTKASCDRLRGAEILKVQEIEISGHNFLMQALKQRNGVIEYAISFALGKNENQAIYNIQSGWLVSEYESSDLVYNFQVWSIDPAYTIELVEGILNKLSFELAPSHEVRLPESYVSKISRENFDLVLKLTSLKENQSIEVFMDENRSETHGFTHRYSPITSAINQELRISINDSYEFEGILVTNGVKQDAFYHGDGNWGLDFDATYTHINDYRISNNPYRELNSDDFLIHRNASISCQSDDYLILYKSLLPANLPADYNEYKYLSFTAKGSGMVEVGLIKSSIQEWKHQYKANIVTRSFEQTFYIPFDYFLSTGTLNKLNAEDLTTITFNLLPSVMGTEDLNLEISDVKFTKTAPEGYEELLSTLQNEFIAYPNPTSGNLNCVLYSAENTHATIQLMDISGKIVYRNNVELVEGRNEFALDFIEKFQGLMLLKINNEKVNYGSLKIIFN